MKYLAYLLLLLFVASFALETGAQQPNVPQDQFGIFGKKKNEEKEEKEEDEDDWRNQDEVEVEDEKLKYYKESYEDTLDAAFEDVYQICQDLISEYHACQVAFTPSPVQDDEGYFKGVVKSDYCVYSRGRDSTWENIQSYGLDVPFIRGGVWETARTQFTFRLYELETGEVRVKLVAQMSGFEEYVTNKFHFWKSNGYEETMMMEKLAKRVEDLY